MSSELIGILGVGVALLGVGVALASFIVSGLRGFEKRLGARIDSLERRVDGRGIEDGRQARLPSGNKLENRTGTLQKKLEGRMDLIDSRMGGGGTGAGKARRADGRSARRPVRDPPRREVVAIPGHLGRLSIDRRLEFWKVEGQPRRDLRSRTGPSQTAAFRISAIRRPTILASRGCRVHTMTSSSFFSQGRASMAGSPSRSCSMT